jgi:ribosomal protein L16 Arg81 hydroxylase
MEENPEIVVPQVVVVQPDESVQVGISAGRADAQRHLDSLREEMELLLQNVSEFDSRAVRIMQGMEEYNDPLFNPYRSQNEVARTIFNRFRQSEEQGRRHLDMLHEHLMMLQNGIQQMIQQQNEIIDDANSNPIRQGYDQVTDANGRTVRVPSFHPHRLLQRERPVVPHLNVFRAQQFRNRDTVQLI